MLCIVYRVSSHECHYVLPDDLSLGEALTNSTNCDVVYISIVSNIDLFAPIKAENVSNITIVGYSVATSVTCLEYSGLLFSNVSNFEMRNLRLQYCGIVVANTTTGYGTPPDLNWEVMAAISFSASFNITIRDVEILNSSGVGMVLMNTGGNVLISNCTFKDNRIDGNSTDVYAGGGGFI